MSTFTTGRTAVQLVRFVVAGATNTAVTGAIFFGLSFVMPASLAYTVAFSLGIGFAVLVTPRFVFGARVRHARRVLYAMWYVAVYLVGLTVVYVLNDPLRLDRSAVVILTVATTATLSFVGARRLFDAGPFGVLVDER